MTICAEKISIHGRTVCRSKLDVHSDRGGLTPVAPDLNTVSGDDSTIFMSLIGAKSDIRGSMLYLEGHNGASLTHNFPYEYAWPCARSASEFLGGPMNTHPPISSSSSSVGGGRLLVPQKHLLHMSGPFFSM